MLDDFQSGFQSDWGTESTLVNVQDDLQHMLEEGYSIAQILLDLSEAFDNIDHKMMLEGLLSVVGLSDWSLPWVNSFLQGRGQSVRMGKFYSTRGELTCGFP